MAKKRIYGRTIVKKQTLAVNRPTHRKKVYGMSHEVALKKLAAYSANRSLLIDTSGRLNPNWEKILKDADLDFITKSELAITLKDYGNSRNTDVNMRLKHYTKKGLNITGLLSIIYSDYVTNTLYNMDLNPAEVARELGVTLDELTNPNNWNKQFRNGKATKRTGDTFINPHNGMRWKFVFDYNYGSYYKQI